MYDLASLLDEHDRLETLADRLIAACQHAKDDCIECDDILAEMRDLLTDHLAAEAQFLYAEGRSSRDAEFREMVAQFEVDFSALDAAWHRFSQYWTAQKIASEYARFQNEARDVMAALKTRIDGENRVIYPMALETGRIRLRLPARAA